MIWIAVDKFGKRFMDEYPPAPQDTGTRPLEFYDADIQDYPRIPCYLIFDEEGRNRADRIPDRERRALRRSWSEDNLAELNNGWIKSGNSLEDIAGANRCESEGAESHRRALECALRKGPGQRPQTAAQNDDADQESAVLRRRSLADRQ